MKWYGHVSCLSGLAKSTLQGTVNGEKRKEVKRQNQEMDRLGVHQVPEGNGEQRQIEETTPTIKVKVIAPFRAQVLYCLAYFMGIVYCPLLELYIAKYRPRILHCLSYFNGAIDCPPPPTPPPTPFELNNY